MSRHTDRAIPELLDIFRSWLKQRFKRRDAFLRMKNRKHHRDILDLGDTFRVIREDEAYKTTQRGNCAVAWC